MKKLLGVISILILVGLLGCNPQPQPQSTPPPVICKVAAGGAHSVALDNQGKVYTWGDNFFGQLGNGNSDTMGLKPFRVDRLTEKVVTIGAGVDHTLVATESGAVYAWGKNDYGQLGDGTKTNQIKPVKVSGLPAGDKIIQVAGGFHFSLALGASGKVYAWGDGPNGELGNGTLATSTTPVTVKTVTGGELTGVKKIAAGTYHALAMIDPGGQIPQSLCWVVAWGSNSNGQLGNDSKNNSGYPVQVSYYQNDVLTILTGISDITAYMGQSLAVNQLGKIWSWGGNQQWEMGQSEKIDYQTAQQIFFDHQVDKVATGNIHSAIVLRNSGYVYTFGSNFHGQLGNPTSPDTYIPVQVSLPDGLGYLANITEISARGEHTLAVNQDGVVYAWGYNSHGQLGDGTTTQRNYPMKVKW